MRPSVKFTSSHFFLLIVHLFGGQMDCQLALMHYLFAEARGARGGDQNSVCQAGATQD